MYKVERKMFSVKVTLNRDLIGQGEMCKNIPQRGNGKTKARRQGLQGHLRNKKEASAAGVEADRRKRCARTLL